MSEFVWKKQELAAVIDGHPERVKKVLVLYTGGTIGMKWSPSAGYEPAHNYFEQKIRTYPQLCDPQFKLQEGSSSWRDMPENMEPIALPPTFRQCRILYTILEYFPLLDSSNLSMEDWARMGKDIEKYYQNFNGFVILHGTDTMAYTASALSFMFQDLGKSVVMTGSQVPISELRNDARDNFLGALIMAGEYVIPEVTIYFHNKLYRGNRATKMNSSNLEPFATPNLPPLATVGIDIAVDWDAIHRPVKTEKFKLQPTMNRNVGILRIFPGITANTVRSFLQPPMEGVVLQTFGAGNVPDCESNSHLIEQLRAGCDRGVIVINCTQCTSGNVTQKYAGSIKLTAAGVVSGADMTAEAALTKLSYLLGKGISKDQIKSEMAKNLRGEMTVICDDQQQFSLKHSEFLLAIAQALNLSSSKEVRLLRETLFPPLMCAAAAKGDIECLTTLHQQGGDFNIPDYDGRTPLHLASSEGHLKTVEYLLHHGASVHTTDRYNHTPLDDAVRFKKLSVIPILVQTGAELNTTTCEIAVQAAGDNDTDAIFAWTLAEPKVPVEDQSPLQLFKRSLDTAASLEARLKKSVRRLSLDFSNPQHLEAAATNSSHHRPSLPSIAIVSPPPLVNGAGSDCAGNTDPSSTTLNILNGDSDSFSN